MKIRAFEMRWWNMCMLWISATVKVNSIKCSLMAKIKAYFISMYYMHDIFMVYAINFKICESSFFFIFNKLKYFIFHKYMFGYAHDTHYYSVNRHYFINKMFDWQLSFILSMKWSLEESLQRPSLDLANYTCWCITLATIGSHIKHYYVSKCVKF